MKGKMVLVAVAGLAYQMSSTHDAAAADRGGVASVYSTESGSGTASGQKLNPQALTAAHRTLPFGTKVTVTYQNFAGVATSSPSSSSSGGGSFFNLFGDDPPAEKPRRKVTRAKSASAKGEPTKSASSQ